MSNFPVEYTYDQIIGPKPNLNSWHGIEYHVRRFFLEREGERVMIVLSKDDVIEPDIDKVRITDVRYTFLAVEKAHFVVAKWDNKVKVLKARD